MGLIPEIRKAAHMALNGTPDGWKWAFWYEIPHIAG
jgi:hypothetical protein